MERKKNPRGLSTLLAFILKSKKLMAVAKAFKALKFLKPMITIGTMFLSLLTYGFMYGWVFGVGIVVMIFVHEMGHVIALRQKGYPSSAPIFIPLLGAVIFAPSKMERNNEAYVGIGGPVLGSIGAIVAYLVYLIHPDHPMIWLVMSYIGVFINLFNMIPIRPLDGGRVTQAIGPWFSFVGIMILFILTLTLKDPGLLLIWVLVLDDAKGVPIKHKAMIIILIWISLVYCLFFDVGTNPPKWQLIVDLIIAVLFGLGTVLLSRRKNNEVLRRYQQIKFKLSDANRPQLKFSVRMKWLSKYLLLTISLFILLIYQQKTITPLMEKQKNNKEKVKKPSPQIAKTCPRAGF